ncbi:phage tail tube protein [Lactobacillus taiwanensis]|uniref:phage tail tube protein n=1 Tax=Lactobacillus taiwanensis TaxID=508451 RepID=UPI00242E28E7|nr:phage capsid protein [Lactobacillus taiwanensis]
MANNLKQIPGSEAPKDGAALNVVNRLYVDTTDNYKDLTDITTGKWAWMAHGINDISPTAPEKTQKTAYYDGNGYDETEVTGKSFQLAVKGVRFVGNAAQDYIDSKQFSIGSATKTRVLWINNGKVLVSACTLTNIVATGGAADAQQTFSLTIACNGTPMTPTGKLTLTSDDSGLYIASVDDKQPATTPAEVHSNTDTPAQN